MAYCRQCGAQLSDSSSFCPSCGAEADNNQNTSGQYNYNANNTQHMNYGAVPNDIEENKLISILCYLGILFLIPYLTKPDSQFVKFHSNQGLVLFLFSLVAGVASNIPFLGWIIGLVCGIFAVVCFIMGIIYVCNGEMKELPIIGQLQILK